MSTTAQAPRQRGRTVMLVGPMPPPVHGMAVVTSWIARIVATNCRSRIADISPGTLRRGVPYHLSKALKVGRAAGLLCGWSFRPRKLLYISADAHWGMLYTIGLVGLGRALGFTPIIHHHSYAYLSRTDRRMTCLTGVAGEAAVHVVLCPAMSEELLARYAGAKRTLVVSNAAFMNRATMTDRSVGSSLRIGHLSNLGWEKGLDLVLASFRELREKGTAARLVLAGPTVNEHDRRSIDGAQGEFGSSVDYRGPVDGADKTKFYRDIDVFLLPTRYDNEAQPLVVLEAMSYGVPVISYARGCIAQLLRESGGRSIDTARDYVAEAVPLLLEWSREPERFVAAGRAAFAKFEALRANAASDLERFKALLTL